MLPAHSRLHRASDIREVSRRGRRRSHAGLAVTVLRQSPAQASRATVVVNKTVGGAVVRNRLRRQVRHGLARVWQQVPAGSAVVVRANRDARALSAAELDAVLVGSIESAYRSTKRFR